MTKPLIDVEQIERDLRQEFEERVARQVGAVRKLAEAAERAQSLRDQIADAEAAQAAAYQDAIAAGLSAKELAKLKPRDGVSARPRRKASTARKAAPASVTSAPAAPAAHEEEAFAG